MAKVVKIKNPVVPQDEETVLTSKYSSGTSLTVKNNEGWADNDIAIVGHPGDELAEAGLVGGISGNTTITIDSALKFSHPVDTPIFRSRYNQISLERKASGGNYAVISEGLQNIEWDERDGFSKIRVAAGEDSDTYKWRFYNSLTATYSNYSGELVGTGLTPQHAGYIIQLIRRFGKIPANSGVTDLDLLASLNRGQQKIDALHERWYFALVEDTSSTKVDAIAGTYKYDLPDGFRGMDSLKALDSNDQKYNLTYVPLIEFDSLKVDTSSGSRSDSTREWSLLPPDSSNTLGYFGVHPTPSSATNDFYRRYWRTLPELTTFASQTLIPIPEALFNWGMYELYKLREDRDNATYYLGLFQEDVKMLKMMQKRQIGQAEFQRFRGQRGYSRLFGEFGVQSRDYLVENYW